MNAPLAPGQLRPAASDRYTTHVVRNQAAPAAGFNAFDSDAVLKAAVARESPWSAPLASQLGQLAGDADVQELARLANKHTPELKTHDRYGNRIDWVDFHPAWHELMALAWRHEVHSLAFNATGPQPLRPRRAVLPVEPGGARRRLPHRHGLRRPRGLRG
jgi:putative acyl-CoA dehydrogenase